MNIEQMLRDAIERKTAKILKEEYGIEMSKDDGEYLNPFDFTLKEVEYMTWDAKAPKKLRRCVRHKKHEI